MDRNFICLFLILFLFPVVCFGKVVVIDDSRAEYLTTPYLSIFHQVGGSKLPEVIRNQDGFRQITEGDVHLSPSKDPYWIKFSVVANSSHSQLLTFSLDSPYLSNIKAYRIENQEPILVYEGGMNVALSDEQLFGRTYAFDQRVEPFKRIDFLFRIESKFVLPGFELTIYKRSAFLRYKTMDSLIFGLYFGIILIAGIYNLAQTAVKSDKNYLYYLITVFLLHGVHVANLYGVSRYLFFPDRSMPRWFLVGSFCASCIASYVFFLRYLNGRENSPFFTRLSLISLVVLVAANLLFGLSKDIFPTWLNGLILPYIGSMLCMALVAIKKQDRTAYFAVFSWVPFLFFAVEEIAVSFFSSARLTRYNLLVGFSLEAIIISLGLGDRLRRMHDNVARMEGEITSTNKSLQSLFRITQMFAHDLRRPYQMIDIAINNWKKKETLPSEIEQFLPKLQNAKIEAEEMIEEMLMMDSSIQVSKEPTSLKKLVSEIVEYEPTLHRVEGFEVDLKHEHLVIFGERHLRRILRNLISNAIQAMSPKGRIFISSREVDDRILLRVGNENSFIDDQQQKNLFRAFYTSDKKGGTGLGLYLVKQIVTAYEGSIYVSSQKSPPFTEFLISMRPSLEKGTSFENAVDDSKVRDKIYLSPSLELTVGLEVYSKAKKNVICFLDDDEFILEFYLSEVENVEGAAGIGFTEGDAFLYYLDSVPSAVDQIQLVVTDYFLDGQTTVEEMGLRKAVANLGFHGPWMLVSNTAPSGLEGFAVVLSKTEVINGAFAPHLSKLIA